MDGPGDRLSLVSSDKEETAPRYYGLELGTVHDNVDPLGLGRVQVIVPGILDQPGPWAPPLGGPGAGSPQRGTFFVPAKGSDIGVFFHRGEPERPYYVGGHYGSPAAGVEVPGDVKDVPANERHKLYAQETEHWKMTFDDRDGKNAIRMKHKTLDLSIEVDGAKGVVELRGDAALNLSSNGFINIDAPVVVIGKRTVLKTGKPIS